MIYCVEDEKNIRELLVYTLRSTGFQAKGLENGEELFRELGEEIPELILLDIMMPGEDGYTILEKLKRMPEVRDVPVIMVTAKGAEFDKVRGLDLGADDYITKPFNPLELIARVKSQLRRYMTLGNYANDSKESEKIIKSSGLEINLESKEVFVEGEPIRVTATEFGILELLLKNKGRVFSIDEIYENVWKEPSYNAENTVAVHIRRIREKIEINPKEPKYLKVVWGIGYKIEKYE